MALGYFCQFRRNYLTKHLYMVEDVDLFAAYIIPVSTWYLIPAAVILSAHPRKSRSLCTP